MDVTCFSGVRDLVFNDFGRKYVIGLPRNLPPIPDPTAVSFRGLRRLPLSFCQSLDDLCRRHQCVSSGDLRCLLSGHGYGCHSLTEKSLRLRVAQLLQNGSLALFEVVDRSPRGPSMPGGQSRPVESIIVGEPKPSRSPVDILVTQKTAVKAPVKIDAQPDPAGQVAVLVAAARQGIPFCEICAKS